MQKESSNLKSSLKGRWGPRSAYHKTAVDLTVLLIYKKFVKPSGWPGRRVAEERRKEKDEGNRKARSIGADPHRESKPGVRSPNIQMDGGTRPMSKLARLYAKRA